MSADGIDNIVALLRLPISTFVQQCYFLILGRVPHHNEVAARSSALRAGLGRIRLVSDIAASPEFAAHQQRLIEHGNDRAFLERVYRMYLGRAPDPSGLAHYLALLSSGKSRSQIRRDIAGSKQARQIGTLWSELEQLLADERRDMHPLKRWMGHRRRRERRHNLELEMVRIENGSDVVANVAERDRLRIGQAHSSGYGLSGRQARALAEIDTTKFSPAALRAFSRLQHANGKT